MRILHIGKYFPPVPGGIENFLYDLTRTQKEIGWDPVVLVHNIDPFRKTVHELVDGVEVIRAASMGSVLYTPVSPVFPVRLKKLLKRKPDLIHVHMPNPSAFWVLAQARDVPIVVHWHSDIVAQASERALRTAYRFYHYFEKKFLDRAAAVIVTSADYLNSSPVLGSYRGKCHVIPLGLDTNRLECCRSDPEKRGRFLIFSAGRFTAYKGFEYLIRAMKEVPDSLLVIAGDGKLFGDMLRLVRCSNLEERVRLTGHVDSRRLYGLMNECDVFCLPSIERTEAFGLVLIEAMSFGKPLITTEIPGSGVNWVNQEGITGLHVPLRDSRTLAESITSLRENHAMRRRMGLNALKRFEENFNIEDTAHKLQRVYESIVQ